MWIVLFTMPGSPPNCRIQKPWFKTASGGPSRCSSSAGTNVRPIAGFSPSTRKYPALTYSPTISMAAGSADSVNRQGRRSAIALNIGDSASRSDWNSGWSIPIIFPPPIM